MEIFLDNEILKIASTQGIWATLSVALIFYVIKNQEKRDIRQEERENKYQDIISMLSNELSIVNGIKDDIKDIKDQLFFNKENK